MATEAESGPSSSRDWSDRASGWLLVFGVLCLISLNGAGLFYLWFASRIKQRNNSFRRIAILICGGMVVLGSVVLIKLFIRAEPPQTNLLGVKLSIPLWVDSLLLFTFVVLHAVPLICLLAPGTRDAHLGAVSVEIADRPKYWFWLIRLAYIPLALAVALVVVSLGRPSYSRLPSLPGAGTQWAWFDDAIRFERWNASINVPGGSYSSAGSSSNPDAMFNSERLNWVTTSRGGGLTVHTGVAYEFRIRVAVWEAAGIGLIALITELLWRRTARLRSGYCPNCGYDLRATLDRCPECGRLVMAADLRVIRESVERDG